MLAALLGTLQFVLNYNFVYAAELYITSGLAAVVFALLVVPNALLAWLFFGQRVTAASSLGSAVAMAGVALLFVQEIAARRGADRSRADRPRLRPASPCSPPRSPTSCS